MIKVRVLLADDHAMMLEGLALLVNGQPDMEVVAQAVNGKEAVRLVAALAPDVAVIDVSMPDMNGIEATQHIVEKWPKTRVLTLTRHGESGYLRRLLRAGA